MEYTILILLLPFLSFLALGLGGKWMSHRTAGLIGTAALGCGRSAFLSHRRNVLQRSPPCRWYVRGANAL